MTMPLMATEQAASAPDAAFDAHVRLIGVTKRLGDFVAVDDISLDIARGEMLTLLGPSGCGKSTTLRLLAGFYQPTQGEIILDSANITRLAPNQRQMTMVFQEYALFPHLSVADNIGYGLQRRRVNAAEAEKRIAEMLDLVGLGGAGLKHPHQLSGGQQQRVALARALAVDPQVLLLDEPLSNLDARLRVRLREEIVRLQRVLGKTMVFVTHDQEEALSISDRIAVMRDGRIEQLDAPEQIYFHPRNRYVAEFVGTANFLPVEIVDDAAIRVGSNVLPFPARHVSGKPSLMVRPECLRLLATSEAGSAHTLCGRIERKSFHGATARYWVQTPIGELIVDCPAPAAPAVGEEVGVQLDIARAHLIGD
ncbi:ABC transporter ATP-binding protein [Bosea massiliensis]|uniref:ABC transporter ATP-binding protein n=1 Tax=Bosea massiliensis TaxID=151419 RepID=A0ABW0P6G3_9HYPH